MKKNIAVIHATLQKSCITSGEKLHLAHTLKPFFRSLLFLLVSGIFLFSCKEDIKLSSEASITSLTLTVGSTDYKVTFTDKKGTITVPYSTKLSDGAVVKVVTLSAKATGVKAGDNVTISASGTVTLTVTAENNTTKKTYTVTVKKAAVSSEAAITSLILTVGSTGYEIDFTDRAYTLVLPLGSTLPSAVGVKQIELSSGATSDAGNELSVMNNTVTITVTAEDKKTTQEYTVTLSMAASVGASITTLTLTVGSADYEIMFQGTHGTVIVPYDTEIPAQVVVKEIALSPGATSVDQGTQLSVTDNAVTITVTAEGGETKSEYTVMFSVAANSEASINTLTLTVEDKDYDITFEDRQGTMTLPYSTEIPAQVEVKEIALSPGATSVDQGTQLTVTNNTVTITVTAADGKTTQEYTVVLAFTTAGITSFTFEVADNESMALDTADRKRIVGIIDHQAGTITFDEQNAYVYRDKLKATFEVSEAGAAVQVGGEDQASGVTEQDFTSPVEYVIRTQGGMETTYRVTLLKSVMATIKDAQFRAKLKELVPAAFTGDQLDITHIAVINYNDLFNIATQTPKLTSLKGVEFFTAMATLNCAGNALTSLDVRKNTALERLYSGNNSLTSLNVRGNTTLTELYCPDNSLISLNVSGNTALTNLDCGNNGLTSLNVSGTTALMRLNCKQNSLTSLDVSGNTALTNLFCLNNSLTSLDMTGMRSVGELYIGTGTGTDNLLVTLRVNTAIQDNAAIIAMKTNRGVNLTITTVNNDGDVVCNDYTPADSEGTCNQAP